MANITRTFWLDLPASNTGRSDIAYALEGGSYTTAGVSESSTIPGRYKVSVTYDASVNTAIGWRIPLSGGGYDYAIEDIYPVDIATSLTAQGYTTGRASRLDYLDASVNSRSTYSGGAVASVTAGVTLSASGLDAIPIGDYNARQALVIIAAQSGGKMVVSPGGGTTFATIGDDSVIIISASTDTTGRTSVALTPGA